MSTSDTNVAKSPGIGRRRLLLAGGLGVFGLAATGCRAPRREAGAASRFEKLIVAGDPAKNGMFDVSVEYGPDGTGWLAYSRVELPRYVSTHLARSDDRGRSWTFVGAINRSRDDTITRDGRSITGARRYETPTLVYDPGDVPSRRWKLYVERYVAVAPHRPDNNLHGGGWIEARYASRPDGQWSEPVRMFGGPETGSRLDLNRLHPDLAAMRFYNELGSIALDGVLYLSLDASTTASGLGDWENRRIILISSRDHGETWRYVGTLTEHDDASGAGYLALTGSSLVKEGDRLFLFITPSGAKGLGRRNRGHDGTWIVEFEDIARARLKRNSAGRLVVLRTIPIEFDTGGLSDYHEQNTNGGILFPQIDTQAPPDVFQTYMTRQRIIAP